MEMIPNVVYCFIIVFANFTDIVGVERLKGDREKGEKRREKGEKRREKGERGREKGERKKGERREVKGKRREGEGERRKGRKTGERYPLSAPSYRMSTSCCSDLTFVWASMSYGHILF